MGLFPFIVAAALLPAAFTAAGYFISFRRMPDDHEIRARKRWKLASRGNAVFLISVIGGLIAVTEGGRDLPALTKILISYLFILITFTPFMIVLGAIDRRVREVEFPLRGYVTFQYFFFFGRWSSILVIVAFLLIPVRLTGPGGGVSLMGTAVMIGGAALFIVCSLYQMRVVGRLTGALVPSGPDDGIAGDIVKLSEKAGVTGTKVLFMETFGYPFYNAFAAPGKIIYITRPLLGALTREELLAIAAHEIGHLTTMKRRTALILGLLTMCVVALWFLVPQASRILSDIGSFVVEIVVALLIFLVAVFALGAANRRFEARADAAAAQLTGGPGPMIAALEKIYRLGMLPRRFDKKGSENASHPSLERRVAALRGESVPAPKGRVRRIAVLSGGIIVIFIALMLLDTGGIGRFMVTDAGYQYSWVDVIGPLDAKRAEDPDNFELRKRLAMEYFIIEEDAPALENADRALAIKRDPGLLLLRGLLLNFSGDKAGALSAMEEAYHLGRSTVALKWAVIIAYDAGQDERARGYIAEIAAISPDDPFVREMSERPSGGSDLYPFVGYSVIFQRKGAAPSGTMPASSNDREEE